MATYPLPNPPVRPAGSTLTSGIYGSDVTDSIQFLVNPPTFVGTQTVAQSIANSAWTAITLDTEQLDDYDGHSTSVNTSRWTCPTGYAGWYTVCGVYAPFGNATGFRAARIQVNGSPILGAASYIPPAGAIDTGIVTPTRDIQLAVGDYVQLAGFQSSGGALNTAIDPDLRSALWLRFSHA